jgi:hypothetical protein
MRITLITLLLMIFQSSQAQDYFRHKSGGKYGFYTTDKTLLIDFQYDDALNFNENMAAVKKDGKWGYINPGNKTIIPFMYDDAWYFTQGLAAVKKGAKWGYIDVNNATVIAFEYDDAADFADGLAWVEKDAKIGYITKSNKVAIPFEYNAAMAFVSGVAGVQKGGKWGVITKENKVIIPFTYSEVGYPVEGYIPVKNSNWAYFDSEGNQITDFTFYSHNEETFTPDNSFAWKYADYTYTKLKSLSKSTAEYYTYQTHLRKATALIREKNTYFYKSEWEKLASYYKLLGDKEKYKEAKKKGGGGSTKKPHLLLGTAPAKLAYTQLKHIPVTAELTFGKLILGARYDKIDNFSEKYRFNQWDHAGDDEYVKYPYSGRELGGYVLAYADKGMRIGLEYRNGQYNFNPFQIQLTPINGGFSTNSTIAPTFQTHDFTIQQSFRKYYKIFYYEFGMSYGLGLKKWNLGYDPKSYTAQIERWNPEDWSKLMLPMRFHFRVGFRLF